MLVLGVGFASAVTFVLPDHLIAVKDQFQATLGAVSPDDGISQREAQAIADAYFYELVSGCGTTEPAILADGVWTVQLRIGYAGALSDEYVRIDTGHGTVSSAIGPSFPNFWLFQKYILWGIA